MRSIILFSSGLDSTFNLYKARASGSILLALTFDYGQRAAPREIAHAKAQCERLGVSHQVVSVPWFCDFTKTSLVDRKAKVPTAQAVQIDEREVSEVTAKAVWVPNRNGILLNIAAGFAEGLGADVIIPGFNAEEAVTFADNSQAFLDSLDHSFSFSTRSKVKTHCYSTHLDKTQIVAEAKHLDMAFDLVWPCYFGGNEPCGECESCLRFDRALKANGLSLVQYHNPGRPS